MRKCPTPLRVRGLTITGIGHPPAECGIKTKDQKATAPLGLFVFSQTHLLSLMAEGFYFKKWILLYVIHQSNGNFDYPVVKGLI